jgi:maltokinase
VTAARPDLVEAVRCAGWAALLPAHRADGEDQPTGAAVVVDALPLGEGRLLVVVADDHGRTYPVPLVTSGEGVRRALPGDGAAEAVVALLAEGDRDHESFRLTRWHHRAAAGERAVTVDQTNESVVIGDAVVVKWTFLADEGPHPAPSLLAALAAAGFRGTPRPWGAVEWRDRLLALAVDYVPGAVDGWTWAVEEVRDAASRGDVTAVAAAGDAVGGLVASFHRALAGTVRTATGDEAAGCRDGAVADLERALSATRAAAHDLLVAHEPALRAAFDALPVEDARVLRVHGDLHVGQVLRSGPSSYVLSDFDGNPVVPAPERVREQPAALDVAGMAQSFMHVGLVVRRHHPDLDAALFDHAATVARDSFLDSYRSGTAGLNVLDERLLTPFRLRQLCRELTYAATHLPRWSYVPEAALPMLVSEHRP